MCSRCHAPISLSLSETCPASWVLQIEHAQDLRLPKPRSTHHNAKLSFSIPLGGCRPAANQLFMELWIASPFKLDLLRFSPKYSLGRIPVVSVTGSNRPFGVGRA